MQVALSAMLRLFAPYVPFVTEEVWSWWQPGSVHRAAWPTSAEILQVMGGADEEGERALDLATAVLAEIRRRKSEEQRPMKTAVTRLVLRLPGTERGLAEGVKGDIAAAGFVQDLWLEEAAERQVEVTLAAAGAVAEPRA
jgi:valyl-tRNA synthetase